MNKLGRLRVSCAVGYLAPARHRPNLTIEGNSHTVRVIVEGGRAVGVEVERAGERQVIRARLVVLSAGALASPAILMRSGIGPAEELRTHGIEPVADLRGVGRNLSDHPALSVVCELREGAGVGHDEPIIQTILRYTAQGSDKRNDLQIEQISFAGRPGGPPMFSIAAVLEYQYGRGILRLGGADPHARPVAECHFCEDPRDLARLVGCMRDALAFASAGALGDMVVAQRFPDPARGLGDDDLAMLCRRFAGSGYHPCGTAKMGPASDAEAVVDQFGCCHGVDQLVVADASIMPSVPRANTNLSSIMIGEKVGEWIRTRSAHYGL